MLRNNLPIARILGIAFIGISTFFLSVILVELTREPYYEGEVNRFNTEEIMALVFAIGGFIIGLGMFFTLKWARFLATLIIFGIGVFSVVMISGEIGVSYSNTVIGIGGIACCVSLALSFGLLMYNRKLGDEFKDIPLEDEYDDAIDSVLM